MTIITRFAPSPTGLLHVGNLRTMLINWLHARSNNGKFILRIDDTDSKRSENKYLKALQDDLKSIGVDWDIIFKQSTRLEKYKKIKDKLIYLKRLYPCYETRGELIIKREKLLKRNLPPIYDRTSLKLSNIKKKELELKGVKPYWRFLLHDSLISWDDGVKGRLNFHSRNLSDPILIRSDETITYNLASVIDDIEYKVTDIIRGEDHISNSALHLQLFEALSTKPPKFSHISLLSENYEKLSKRKVGNSNIKELIKRNIVPKAISSFLIQIGHSNAMSAKKTLQDLTKEFSLQQLSKSTIQYHYKELMIFNTKVLRCLEFVEIKPILKSLNINNVDESFWLFIRTNIDIIEDIKYWDDVCKKDIETIITDNNLITIARKMLPNKRFDYNTWDKWIKKIKEHTKLRGKNLFMPLRLALTGRSDGPNLRHLITLINRNLIINRLK